MSEPILVGGSGEAAVQVHRKGSLVRLGCFVIGLLFDQFRMRPHSQRQSSAHPRRVPPEFSPHCWQRDGLAEGTKIGSAGQRQ
jgi:hypothetical protein